MLEKKDVLTVSTRFLSAYLNYQYILALVVLTTSMLWRRFLPDAGGYE